MACEWGDLFTGGNSLLSSYPPGCRLASSAAGLRMEIIDDTLFELSWFASEGVGWSGSVAENDRLRDDRNDAGDNDGCLSSLDAIVAREASRLSSLRRMRMSWGGACEV